MLCCNRDPVAFTILKDIFWKGDNCILEAKKCWIHGKCSSNRRRPCISNLIITNADGSHDEKKRRSLGKKFKRKGQFFFFFLIFYSYLNEIKYDPKASAIAIAPMSPILFPPRLCKTKRKLWKEWSKKERC